MISMLCPPSTRQWTWTVSVGWFRTCLSAGPQHSSCPRWSRRVASPGVEDEKKNHRFIKARIAREIAFQLNRVVHGFWNFSIINPLPLDAASIASIQSECLKSLERKYPSEIVRHFIFNRRLMDTDLDELKEVRLQEARRNKRVQQMESSMS